MAEDTGRCGSAIELQGEIHIRHEIEEGSVLVVDPARAFFAQGALRTLQTIAEAVIQLHPRHAEMKIQCLIMERMNLREGGVHSGAEAPATALQLCDLLVQIAHLMEEPATLRLTSQVIDGLHLELTSLLSHAAEGLAERATVRCVRAFLLQAGCVPLELAPLLEEGTAVLGRSEPTTLFHAGGAVPKMFIVFRKTGVAAATSGTVLFLAEVVVELMQALKKLLSGGADGILLGVLRALLRGVHPVGFRMKRRDQGAEADEKNGKMR